MFKQFTSEKHLIKLYLTRVCPKIIQFTFWKVHTWASSAEGGFGSWFSHLFCVAMTGNKSGINPSFWTTEEERRSDFELWDIPCCHTLPDYFSPACCWRESKRIRAVTQVYISALWVFALFAVLQIQWDFMPKSYTKNYIRVRRKFYKFVNAYNWNIFCLTTTHHCVIWNKEA